MPPSFAARIIFSFKTYAILHGYVHGVRGAYFALFSTLRDDLWTTVACLLHKGGNVGNMAGKEGL